MLKLVPSDAAKHEIRERCKETMNLAGARMEMVERELARKEMWVDEIEEFRDALEEYKKSCLD